MAKGLWVKTSQSGRFKTVTGLFVKVSPSTWQSVNDAWVKVKATGTNAFQKFWESATNPVTPIEILTDFTTTTEQLRLQGKNYRWTPTPSTLFYTFSYVDNTTATTYSLTSSTSTSNPSAGSSITVPSSTTYRSISRNASDNEFAVGGLSTYKFTVTGTTSSGASSVQTAEYSMRTPAAPTITVEKLSGTSVRLTITAASDADYQATYRYIVYTSDSVGGLIESGGGRGGYAANANPKIVTLTGLTAGRTYDIYVAPFTGSTGTTTANASGYPGAEGYVSTQPVSDYTFTFGKVLHVGTNGYISLDSGNSNDAISSTSGKVLGILPGDLYQSTTNSVWYWSDENKFVIRWEGYHYNQPDNLRQYEVVFVKNTNYATVYGISVANTSEGLEAYVKDGVALTSYATAMTTNAWRVVYFDSETPPGVQFGPYITTSKSVMKQVTGLTAGTQDQGYTSITTSINQNVVPTLGAFDVSSFTKGTVSASSQGALRTTTLTWGESANATRYEVQYQGSTDNVNWTTVQTYASSPYNSGTTESKIWATAEGYDFPFYTFMRANVRASESTATSTYVYSNSGSYVNASGVAPGPPTFGTITTSNTTASIPFTVGTTGTNFLYTTIEYMYKSAAGTYPTTWSTATISNGSGTISLTGLTEDSNYYIKIRTRNLDELYSSEVESAVFKTTTGGPIRSVTYDGNGVITVNANGGGPYWQIYWLTVASFPNSSAYDAASTTPTITESLFPSPVYSYWFYVRYSTQNLGNTTQSGNATAGTFGPYFGPYIMRHITYNFNGGSNPNFTSFVADGSKVNLPIPTPRIGYTYDGWNTAADGTGTTVGTSTDTEYTLSSTLTIYVKWKPNTYIVSYDANGGSGAPSDQTKVHGTNLTLSATAPTRANFIFTGWNTNSSGTGTNYSSSGTYTDNSAVTLYAKWGNLYTISFDSQGGTAVSALQQSTVGGSIAKPTDPTKTGSTFLGWATSSTGTTAVTWPRTPTASETLYAIWASVPGAVRNLSAAVIAAGRRFSWDAPASDGGSAITRYEITRNANNDNPPTGWFTNSTNLTYDYTLSAGTYTIYVRAVNAAGNGPASSVTVTIAPPFVQPQFNGTYPKFSTATTSNFQRVTGTSANFRWGWGNGTFSFSGSVDTNLNKGWNWHFGSTQLSAGTARTATSYKSFSTSNDTRIAVNGVFHPNLVWSGGNSPEVTYSANARYLSIQAFCFGTDSNEYNGSWTGGI